MRLSGSVSFGLALLAAFTAGSAGAADSTQASTAQATMLAGGCEPSGDLELGARLMSLSRQDGRARALVQLTLVSRFDLEDLRLDGQPLPGEGRLQSDAGALAAARTVVAATEPRLRRQSTRLVQVEVDLEDGVDQHILFTASGLDRSGQQHATSASVRIDLDAARQPLVSEDLIEYRAEARP